MLIGFYFSATIQASFGGFGCCNVMPMAKKEKGKFFSNLPVFTVFNMQLPCFSDQRHASRV